MFLLVLPGYYARCLMIQQHGTWIIYNSYQVLYCTVVLLLAWLVALFYRFRSRLDLAVFFSHPMTIYT